MKTLLPADTYTVVNKTILSEIDRRNLINLYEPIIGAHSVSLYLTLWNDLDKSELISRDYTHHHLMAILKSDLELIKVSRESLEAVSLIRTYIKEGETNNYVYELYSPLTAYDFFNHPIFNIVLYNNIGKNEYNYLKEYYSKTNINLDGYEEISKEMNKVFRPSNKEFNNTDVKKSEVLGNNLSDLIDFNLIISSLPKNTLNEKAFNKRTKELVNSLSFVYDLDTLKITELIRKVLNEHGLINKEELRKEARKYYQYVNDGSLPTLIYRTQPEHLKAPSGDTSNRGKMLYVFENTTPYDFLRSKYRGSVPTNSDLRLLEYLAVDLNLKPAVINVLVDYVLKRNNNRLTKAYIETIAGQWKRSGIETANEAMELAEKQHKKNVKKSTPQKSEKIPIWFDKEIKKEEISKEEQDELEDLLKEFR